MEMAQDVAQWRLCYSGGVVLSGTTKLVYLAKKVYVILSKTRASWFVS